MKRRASRRSKRGIAPTSRKVRDAKRLRMVTPLLESPVVDRPNPRTPSCGSRRPSPSQGFRSRASGSTMTAAFATTKETDLFADGSASLAEPRKPNSFIQAGRPRRPVGTDVRRRHGKDEASAGQLSSARATTPRPAYGSGYNRPGCCRPGEQAKTDPMARRSVLQRTATVSEGSADRPGRRWTGYGLAPNPAPSGSALQPGGW